MKAVLAQLNFLTGDIHANTQQIITAIESAQAEQADLIAFPELAITGYPPEDLVLRDDFHQAINKAMQEIKKHSDNIHIVLGYPEKTSDAIYNAAAVFYNQEKIANYRKQCLPNYSVFDEKRYFTPGQDSCVFKVSHVNVGVLICEDMWHERPAIAAHEAGAQMLLVINASPFDYKKQGRRHDTVRLRQKATGLPVMYLNLVGGQDELLFDGASFALNKRGEYAATAKHFEPDLLSLSTDALKDFIPSPAPTLPSTTENVYDALVLAVKDYVRKNGFKGAVLGLSGGIDSALTLAIAVDALGKDNVQAVMMPSRYTSDMSLIDAEQEAKVLGVQYTTIAIERAYTTFLDLLKDEFENLPTDTTEENLQARCRGVLLMAISNKTGKLVLTTGNKSEMSVGYATLYGDMAGGFAVLKDVPKMLVYELANYRNTISEVIPANVISRPPSAELAPDQIDENSLPPYSILDAILERYVEQDQSVADIVLAGYERETVEKVIRLVKLNEYKRRQAPPGPRVTPRAYGRDRRYPITSGF